METLLELTRRAALGKRRHGEVARWLLDPVPRLQALQLELARRSYEPGVPRGFVIHEPKRRLISALPFRDRIVQHYLIARTLPALERWFAPQSYACRIGFGTHRALRRAAELHRVHPWLLRIDIAKFFPSIDHEQLLHLLLPRCARSVHWLVRRILAAASHIEPVTFHFPDDQLWSPLERPHGLPIGNLTSQVWANVMLTPIDHLIGSHLGLGCFVRYCDDLLIYTHDRARLEAALVGIHRRCDQLRLRLHPRKCRLHRTSEPVTFVGFVLRRDGDRVVVRLRQEAVRRFRARLATTVALFEAGALEPHDVIESLHAWLAHAAHAHTRALVQRVLRDFSLRLRSE